ncbi:MAG: phosphoribosylanthranilate isomerase [Chloroflexi bacterium]|nr:phosphoribosylanthranilate isomerase [Chloroflexota bacterium]
MTLVKICGNRTPEDVLAAAEAGADFVGMMFAASKRQVDVEQARAMVRALGAPLEDRAYEPPPPATPGEREDLGAWFRHGADVVERYIAAKRPLTVGVFADQPIEYVNEVADQVGVDLVQLSGDETWEDCLRITRPVIQVAHISPLDAPADVFTLVQPGFALALMLDSAHGPYRGGTGVTFDWTVASELAARMPMILAGGLNPENVEDAVRTVRPWVVDVASGTETDGKKDHSRVRSFIEIVRAADAALAAEVDA